MIQNNDTRVDNIIKEARHSFITDGYAAAKVEPIAKAAGVSTATLYHFFPSKSVLFEAVIEKVGIEFNKRIISHVEIQEPSRAVLVDYLAHYADFLSDSFVRKMFRLVLAERPRFNEKAEEFFDTGRGDIAKNLIRIFERMHEKGLVKIEKPGWAVSQLLGMIEHPILLLPLATGKDPVLKSSSRALAEDAVETFWARYGCS